VADLAITSGDAATERNAPGDIRCDEAVAAQSPPQWADFLENFADSPADD